MQHEGLKADVDGAALRGVVVFMYCSGVKGLSGRVHVSLSEQVRERHWREEGCRGGHEVVAQGR